MPLVWEAPPIIPAKPVPSGKPPEAPPLPPSGPPPERSVKVLLPHITDLPGTCLIRTTVDGKHDDY